MHNVAAHMNEFEKHSNTQYLPPYLGGYVDEVFLRGHSNTQVDAEAHSSRRTAASKRKPAESGMQQVPPMAPGVGNAIWLAVSGYQPDRAYLVYRFFLDIGHIVDKSFTDTNLMYLKYFCFLDCEIALSYDGQRIGYGGDILVSVKAENPVFATRSAVGTQPAILDAVEAVRPGQSAGCVIEIGSPTEQVALEVIEEADETVEQTEPAVENTQVAAAKQTSYFKWLKQKISYLFYFY